MFFSLNQLKNIPELVGIYKFYSSDKSILYVGKAKDLKKRVSSYFVDKIKDAKTAQMISQVKQVEIIPVASEFEAILLEAKLIKENQPKYNVVWRDDKHFLYIKITDEKFQRVLFARKAVSGGRYFGPFPSATIVKELLGFLRSIFPYCTIGEGGKRPCFYTHLGLCHPCPAEIKKLPREKSKPLTQQYRLNVLNIQKILEGKVGYIKQMLTKKMRKYAKDKYFEEAAKIRDRIASLDYLVNQYAPIESYITDPHYLKKLHHREQKELLRYLRPYFPALAAIKHIECYDISNISGKAATGSMVTFRNNLPDKNLYRRFRIKFTRKPNDFAMLNEIMTRRLKHPEWKLPDIIVVDGGQPQLAALQKILDTYKISIPMIGLAKHDEEIVIAKLDEGGFVKLKLAENSAALHLVKRVRDEAHRFAHRYYSMLRLKHLLNPAV